MRIDDLILLALVQKAGSLSAAARSLNQPKATLSRHLAALETSVGNRLFVPGARRLTLTDFGAELAQRAQRHAEEFEETTRWIQSRDDHPKGLLRVHVPAEFAMLLLAETFASFIQRYPDVKLELDTTPRRIDLVEEAFDVALRIGPVDDVSLVGRRFMLLERSLYASATYVKNHGLPSTPADLSSHQFVILGQAIGMAQVLKNGKKSVEFQPSGPVQCNSIGLTLALVRAGSGIGSFPAGMMRADLENGVLVPILPDWQLEPLPVTVLTASRRLMPTKTRAFIDHLFETAPHWGRLPEVKEIHQSNRT